ncbi:MAG: FHA domain-containing protein [Clostridia bacterium]|nr:FHA domain-containing protein [Clostridia bacterium]
MKILKIGRDQECDIRYDDPKISKHHAILRLHMFGKIEIIDQNSSNGTFVNNKRIKSGEKYPIKRKDKIDFAHANKLDWHEVPNQLYKLLLNTLCVLVSLFILIGLICYFTRNKDSYNNESFVGGGESSSKIISTNESDAVDSGKSSSTELPENKKEEKNSTQYKTGMSLMEKVEKEQAINRQQKEQQQEKTKEKKNSETKEKQDSIKFVDQH